MEHLGSILHQRHHGIIANLPEPAGIGEQSGIPVVHPVYIRENLADIRLQPGRQSHRRGVRAAPTQSRDISLGVNALKTEQTRLLELLSQADNMTDLLEIESRLTDVRDELERYASRLKVLENRVDYATVNLSISEVKEYTPVEEKTRLEKIGEGFVKSLKDLGSGILDFFTWLLIDLPYLLVFGLVVFLAVKLLKAIRKKTKAKKQKKETTD